MADVPTLAPGAFPSRLGTVLAVPIDRLHPNPKNPRRNLGDLTGMVRSIKKYGVLSPVMAERTHSGQFRIRYGARRHAAARKAGLSVVPTLVVPEGLPDEQLIMAMIENLHRAPMSPIDEAHACQELLEMGFTRAEVADAFAHNPAWVAARLALLELPSDVQRQVDAGSIPLGSATELGKKVRRQATGSVVVGDRSPSHFTNGHPLATSAKARCDQAGHPTRGRVGPACGACWEREIRDDQAGALRGVA
jgi:ParB/RepB/Spo0J family partition protein